MKTIKDTVLTRWLVLVLVSGLTFATYWAQDFMGGIKDLLTSQFGFTDENFGRIIGMTTLANMFGMIIVGGIILDKWGIRLAGLLFGGLAAIGALIVWLASIDVFGDDVTTKLWMMCVGRMMFGSGLEVVCVVATRTTVKWFKGYELALAMAINVGFGRLGSAMGIAVSPDIAVGAGSTVSTSIGFAASLLFLAMLMFVVYLFFDIKLDKQQKVVKTKETSDDEEFKISDLLKLVKDSSFIYITLLCVAFYAAVFPCIQYAPDLLVNKFGFTSVLPESAAIIVGGSATLGNALVYIVLFVLAICFSVVPSNLKSKTVRLVFRCVIVVALVGFVWYLRDIFEQWLHNGSKTASLIPLGTIIFTPVFGNIVDKKGKAASLMILGSLLLIFAHVSLSLFNSVVLGYVGLLSLGIAFSLVPSAMWPSVAKIIPESRLGTAYATMFTVQNWGLGLFYWGLGTLLEYVNRDNTGGVKDYTVPVLVLVVCGMISIFLAYKLKQADRKAGYGLELPNIKES